MQKEFEPMAQQLVSYCQKQLGFKRPPKLFLKQDEENASNSFGRTGQYDPEKEEVTIYFSGRHIKDVLRSLSHELIHHHQNLRGDLSSEKCGKMGPGYAQNNKHMRNMEKEAYLVGNMIFRDWEDSCKNKALKENKIMSAKLTKNSLHKMINETFKNKLKQSCGCPDLIKENRQAIVDSPIKQKKIVNRILKRVTKRILAEQEGEYGCDDLAVGGHGEIGHEQWCADDQFGRDPNNPDHLAHCEPPATEAPAGNREDMGMAYNRPDEGIPGVGLEENRARTPEQASLIYEQRFRSRDTDLFTKLVNKWTK